MLNPEPHNLGGY